MPNRDQDYDAAAKALVDAMLGKEPEPKPPATQAKGYSELTIGPNNDVQMSYELSQDRQSIRFEAQVQQSLVAFHIPMSVFEGQPNAITKELVMALALEVIAHGTINLAALQRRLSPEPCHSCEDLGWRTQYIGSLSNTVTKWIICPYCNNRYDKPEPDLGAL